MGTRSELEAVATALGPLARSSVSLAPLCTYKVGGSAALFVEADSVADLQQVATAITDHSPIDVLVIGNGSNLLVADAGFDGIVVHLGPTFASIEIDRSSGRAILGGAALLPVAARRSAAESLTGFEWAVGVPGSIGGAVTMNAGGHGSDMSASLTRVSVFDLCTATSDGGPVEWSSDRLELGYRRSAIEADHVVLFAELQLAEGDRSASEDEISEIVRWRRANQPGGQNAGSVFTNPAGDSAGRLIDAAGLKGFRIGTAEVSTKHANFIQADPAGSADDVRRLIEEIKVRVFETFGVALHCENRLVGFDSSPSASDEHLGGKLGPEP